MLSYVNFLNGCGFFFYGDYFLIIDYFLKNLDYKVLKCVKFVCLVFDFISGFVIEDFVFGII